MRIRHFSQGKWYEIECPEGSRVERASGRPAPGGAPGADRLIVAWDGQEIPIPADPEELLPLLAESGRCGLALCGEPVPGPDLAGVSCPGCDERDVQWLAVEPDGRIVHCDACGVDFDPRRSGTGHPAEVGLDIPSQRVAPRRR
jgi:Zn ribbon nucleic-acid-binding protein